MVVNMKVYIIKKCRFLKNLSFFLGGICFGSSNLIIAIIALAIALLIDFSVTFALSKSEVKTGQSNDLLWGSWIG